MKPKYNTRINSADTGIPREFLIICVYERYVLYISFSLFLGFKYKLLVICSSENEFKCRLVAALDKYRRPNLSIGGYQSVKQYVQRVLTKDTQRINNPASGVDFDRYWSYRLFLKLFFIYLD